MRDVVAIHGRSEPFQTSPRRRIARGWLVAALGAVLMAACEKDPPPAGPYAGIRLSVSDLSTSEGGPNVAFNVSLATQPSADVTLDLTSTDSTEGLLLGPGGTVSSTTVAVTFTPQNWEAQQTVQVVPQNDPMADGNITYTITVGVGTTADPTYASVPDSTISVTNSDDEVPGVTVSRTSATTSESGTTATFTVRLNTQPTATVTIPVRSLDVSEGLVRGGSSPTTYVESIDLTFTATNYNLSQTVTISGRDDSIDDGNQTYGVQVGPATGATEYAALLPQTIAVTNTDNDTAGITVVASAAPLVTSENGTTATFTVRLNTEPTADVILPVTSGNVAEGLVSSGSQNLVQTANLTFTAANWSTAQTVTVTGQDEVATQVPSDNVTYAVTVGPATGAPEYVALAAQSVSVMNLDNDTPTIIVPQAGGTPLQTRESGTGTTATFTLRLNKAPTADVVVPVTPSDTTEGLVQGGSSPTTPQASVNVTFTTADWQTAQTITVVGQPDFVDDGNQTYTIAVGPATSADTGFNGVAGQSVSVTNIDTDVAGFTVSTTTLSHTEGGAVTTFTVRLNTIPSADVVIPVTSSNAAEGLVSGGSIGSSFGSTLNLTFTPVSWQTVQTVSVKGPTDDVDDGNRTYTITVGPPSSSDPAYAALLARTIGATNVDIDTAGFTVTPQTGLATTEAGGTATFTVRLDSKPTANVSITVSVNDATEVLVSSGTAGPASSVTLTFTATDWSTPQTVTVTGQQDTVGDGPRPFTVTVSRPASTDAKYAVLSAKTVTGSNADDDVSVSEGSIGSPVAPTVPYDGQVSSSAPSFYVLASLSPAAYVILSRPNAAVTFGVYSDASFTTPICDLTVLPWATSSCYVAGGGTVYVRVATAAAEGSGYLLEVSHLTTYTSTDVPKSISDYSTVYSTLPVTGATSAITKVTVRVTISHTYAADLDLFLFAPDGTQIELSTDNGGGGNGYSNVTFDDAAASSITSATPGFTITGTWRPEQPLSGLNGKNANGTWTLRVSDDLGADVGSLTAWNITVR